MSEDNIVGEGIEGERPRPKVVDKRVSARPPQEASAAPETPSEEPPAATAEQPAPPPETQERQDQHPDHGPGAQVWTPEAEAEARAIAQEIADRPGIEWVVNSAVSLANIAATKLDIGRTADAQIVIDALAGILKEVGGRLGEVEQPLRQTLAQLQMAFAGQVQPPGAPPA